MGQDRIFIRNKKEKPVKYEPVILKVSTPEGPHCNRCIFFMRWWKERFCSLLGSKLSADSRDILKFKKDIHCNPELIQKRHLASETIEVL
jgi:hypothetical protein